MKNFGRKMLGLLLAISMLCAILPVAVMASMSTITSTDGGYMKFEETDRSDRFLGFQSSESSNANMSGGKYQLEWNSSRAVGGDLQFDVNIPETGNYKIWVHGGTSNSEYSSPSALIIDKEWSNNTYTAGTVLNWETITGSKTESGMNIPTAYHMVTAYLTAGTHTIDYYLTAKRASNGGTHWVGVFDFMLIIPEVGYDDWTPSITGLPTERTYNKNFNADGYAWFQAEDYSARSGFGNSVSNANFVGGTAYGLANTNAGTYYVDYYMNVPRTAKYDVWVNGTDPSYEWCSPAKLLIDGTEYATNPMSDRLSQSAYIFQWRKTTITLTAGKHNLRYLINESRSAGTTYYIGILDVICIVPNSWGWTNSLTPPVKPATSKNAWIEAETATSGFTSKPSRAEFSAGTTYQLATQNAPANAEDGHYVEYDVNLQAGTYDIYFRGCDDLFGGNYISNATAYVDGVEKEYTEVLNEGWGNQEFATSLSNYAHGWVKVSNVSLTDDTHTLRWAYLTKPVGNGSWYLGGLDCIAVLPSGTPFTPTKNNPTNTKLDYDIAVALSDVNLSGVTEDITLPSTLADGTAVTWSSSNTSVIANDGTVTRPVGIDATVTLTATASEYSKDFTVTVSSLTAYYDNAWIEGENYTRSNYTSTKSDDNCDVAFSGNAILKLASDTVQGYSEYDVNLEAGSYDIYFRGGDNFNSGTWTSNVTPSIDGTVKEYTQVAYEGWPKWNGANNNYDQGWVKVSNVSFAKGTHTLRWEYLDSRASGSTFYIGGLDCIAVVPAGTQFAPIANNIANTKLDYDIAVALLGENLAGVTEDLTLPSTLADGTAVTWSSSNTNFIANDGTVTRPENTDANVTLTATAGGYSKEIAVTVTAVTAYHDNAWIEGENYTRSNYTSTKSDDNCNVALSGNSMLKLSDASKQGYSEYDVNLAAGTYDIYFRGGDNFNGGTWTSNVTPSIDGTVKAYTQVVYEGWPKWNDKTDQYDQGWVKISGVELTEDTHTIRWEYLDSRAASTTYYAGGLDCIAVVPADTAFTPIANNIANTKLDYYIALAFSDEDLTNVTENLTLPSILADGTAVTWSSDNTAVIANDGTVTRPENIDAVVTLTATAGGYEKEIEVTVANVVAFYRAAWIEGENYTRSNYTTTKSDTNCDITFSGNKILKLESTTLQGYSEYDVNLQTGTYDIYFRGSDNFNNGTWTSNVTPSVDGTVKAYTQVAYEGWPKWDGATKNYDQGWVKVSGVELSEGTHTLRWEYLDSRVSSSTYYLGGLDCIAVVPAGTAFTPIEKNITDTKLDYILSTLLVGEDLDNITGNITLPTTLSDGTVVSWTSSNTAIITNGGAVTQPAGRDAVVTLTATADGYSKSITVTVKEIDPYEITDFAISGSCVAGGTVTATVKVRRQDNLKGQANFILAIYKEDGKLGDMIANAVSEKALSDTATTFNCSVTIDPSEEGTLFARAFLWTDFMHLKPLTDLNAIE